ncbi:peptidase S8/S53 domain-containing protein [Xylaria venustula]|nr:peptidase S8/S53 domain-containing protein [Xylaria venustula]
MASLVTQRPAPDDLRFVSQPPGQALGSLKGYTYHENAGKGSLVYVVDTGAEFDHPEFSGIRTDWEWLFPFPDLTGIPGQGRGPHVAHGTSMLSKVSGKECGVSKNVKAVVVRIPTHSDFPKDSKHSNGYGIGKFWTRGVELVLEDLIRRRNNDPNYDKKRTAIVNLSVCLQKDVEIDEEKKTREVIITDDEIRRLREAIDGLVENGALPITGSGNGTKPIDGWPALFGKPSESDSSQSGLLVVGGVDLNGQLSQRSQKADWGPVLHAPSERVRVACNLYKDYSNFHRYKVTNGTSEAGAIVSGLAAELQQVPGLEEVLRINDSSALPKDRVLALKDYIISTAWRRLDDGKEDKWAMRPRAIWNSLDTTKYNRANPWSNSEGTITSWKTKVLLEPPIAVVPGHFRADMGEEIITERQNAKTMFKCPPDQFSNWRWVVQIFARHLKHTTEGTRVQMKTSWSRGTAWFAGAAHLPHQHGTFLLTAAHNVVTSVPDHDTWGVITNLSVNKNALADAIFVVAGWGDNVFTGWVDTVSVMGGYLVNDNDHGYDGAALHIVNSDIPPEFYANAPLITCLPQSLWPAPPATYHQRFAISGFPGFINEFYSLRGLYISGKRAVGGLRASLEDYQAVEVTRNNNGTITFSDSLFPTSAGMSGSPALMLISDTESEEQQLIVVASLHTGAEGACFDTSPDGPGVDPLYLLQAVGATRIKWGHLVTSPKQLGTCFVLRSD